MQVTLVPFAAQRAGFQRLSDGAIGLRHMAAVTEAPLIAKSAKLRKAAVELFGGESPGADLAKPGRVDDVAAVRARQRKHQRTDGRVPALVVGFAGRTHAQVGAGEQRVEKR